MTWRKMSQVVQRAVVRTISSRNATEERDGNEPSFPELEVVNVPTRKTESLKRALDRADSVLENQLMTLTAIQDKAVKIVRVEVILLGVVASFTQLASRSLTINVWVKVSSILLIGSIVAGIFTSNSSSPDLGPGPDYVRPNIDSGDKNEDVYLKLLQGYSEAISYNKIVMNDSAKYLFITQVLLVTSVIVGGFGLFTVF